MKNQFSLIKATALLITLFSVAACSEDMEPTPAITTRSCESMTPEYFDNDSETDGETSEDNNTSEVTFSASEWSAEESSVDL